MVHYTQDEDKILAPRILQSEYISLQLPYCLILCALNQLPVESMGDLPLTSLEAELDLMLIGKDVTGSEIERNLEHNAYGGQYITSKGWNTIIFV